MDLYCFAILPRGTLHTRQLGDFNVGKTSFVNIVREGRMSRGSLQCKSSVMRVHCKSDGEWV